MKLSARKDQKQKNNCMSSIGILCNEILYDGLSRHLLFLLMSVDIARLLPKLACTKANCSLPQVILYSKSNAEASAALLHYASFSAE